jgi:hypothetical protein
LRKKKKESRQAGGVGCGWWVKRKEGKIWEDVAK